MGFVFCCACDASHPGQNYVMPGKIKHATFMTFNLDVKNSYFTTENFQVPQNTYKK